MAPSRLPRKTRCAVISGKVPLRVLALSRSPTTPEVLASFADGGGGHDFAALAFVAPVLVFLLAAMAGPLSSHSLGGARYLCGSAHESTFMRKIALKKSMEGLIKGS